MTRIKPKYTPLERTIIKILESSEKPLSLGDLAVRINKEKRSVRYAMENISNKRKIYSVPDITDIRSDMFSLYPIEITIGINQKQIVIVRN